MIEKYGEGYVWKLKNNSKRRVFRKILKKKDSL